MNCAPNCAPKTGELALISSSISYRRAVAGPLNLLNLLASNTSFMRIDGNVTGHFRATSRCNRLADAETVGNRLTCYRGVTRRHGK